jgi:hypothetical protein
MKKDMGGAANVLGLASLVMGAKLPVRLQVLIPAVENSIAGNAFRPATSSRRARACTSRSAIPTPRAASSCATRWPTAPRASPI